MNDRGGILTPEYARPDLARPKTVLWYVAVACGGAPLIVGCAVCMLFLITRTSDLAILGFLTIVGGLVAFVTGITCLGAYVWDAKRHSSVAESALDRQRGVALALLLSNFPAAVVCIVVGSWANERYSVTVTNSGTTMIESAIVNIQGRRYEFGPLARGETRSKSFSLREGTFLTFSTSRNGETMEGEGADYVDGDQFYDFKFDVTDRSIVTNHRSRSSF